METDVLWAEHIYILSISTTHVVSDDWVISEAAAKLRLRANINIQNNRIYTQINNPLLGEQWTPE